MAQFSLLDATMIDPELTRYDDVALFRLCQAGSAIAFAVLYGRYRSRIRRFHSSALANDCDVDDAVQQTFMRLWRGRDQFDPQRKLAPWLYRIAQNVRRTAIRRIRREHSLQNALRDLSLLESGGDAPVDTLLRREQIGRCFEAMAQLTSEHREVVEQVVLNGVQYGELSASLQIPCSTLRCRMLYARKNLRRQLSAAASLE